MLNLYCVNKTKLDEVMQNGKIDAPFCIDVDYILFVDEIPVVLYKVILQKYNGVSKGIWSAEVQYENIFARDDKSKEEKGKYLKKGYATEGLNLLTDQLMTYQVPFIHLDISPNNIRSIGVAERCGYKKIGDSYYKYHPNVLELLYYSLGNYFTEEQKSKIIEKFRIGHEQNFGSNRKTY